MIFKMARDRTQDKRDVKRGAVIKDNNGRLIRESKEVLRIWAANFKELLNGNGAASCLELPSSVRREVEVEKIGQEEMQTAIKDRLHFSKVSTEIGRHAYIAFDHTEQCAIHHSGDYLLLRHFPFLTGWRGEESLHI